MLLSAAAPSAEALASVQGNQVAQTAEYSELLGFDPAMVMNAKTGSKAAPRVFSCRKYPSNLPRYRKVSVKFP